MRFPFKPIIIGLLIGAAIFFMPFRFPFFFLFIFIFLFGRFFFWRWGRSRYYWRHRAYENYNDVLPIDGYSERRDPYIKDPERKINVD